jgi:hypothetical protein
MEFAGNNAAGVAPAVLDAPGWPNEGLATAYADDAATKRIERRFDFRFVIQEIRPFWRNKELAQRGSSAPNSHLPECLKNNLSIIYWRWNTVQQARKALS